MLGHLFETIGVLLSVSICTLHGESRGCGYITMHDQETALRAKDQLNGNTLDGRQIQIHTTRPNVASRPQRLRSFRRRGFSDGWDTPDWR
ncbi:MAG: hypothetical protein EZS28_009276 [Streblomastix strix]|uniref:RRM domain-containing protein n=1 Tax=Streblomastix strix TaxID=222440 RepID=A0A5J4WJK9_9EUKA|nr:MAG: hypothetical protein EZS28_009276 [Streblomastix strix]